MRGQSIPIRRILMFLQNLRLLLRRNRIGVIRKGGISILPIRRNIIAKQEKTQKSDLASLLKLARQFRRGI